MPVYIAMLRGINVGGQKSVKMARLRQSLEALRFENVQTYLQSGNVVFTAAKHSPLDLSKKIEEQILRDFGFSVSVISKTAQEMGRAIQSNPFLRESKIDLSRLHVTFLDQAPSKPALMQLKTLASPPDRLHHSSTEIYLYCPDGYGRTKFSNNALERVLSVCATTRNWNTVNELYKMASGYK